MSEKTNKYIAIVNRAREMGIERGEELSALMDIESADLHFDLRLV